MLQFVSRELAADYTHEFEQRFGGRFGTSKRSATPYPQVRVGATRVEIYFSPEDGVAKHVLQRLAAEALHTVTDGPIWPAEQAESERYRAAACAQLDEAA